MNEGWTRAWIPVATVGVTALAVGAMWLPWFRSGSAGRNSFAMFRAAQILGIEWITPLRIVWFLLPVVLLVAVATLAFQLPRATCVVAGILGTVLAASGFLALLSLGTEPGPAAATLAGLCSIVLAIPGIRGPV